MGRGAPNKPGLTYFPKMLDFYEDDKVFELLDEYGPLGVTIYDCILCIVYKNGYYAEIPLDKLSRMIIRMIGNKWIKNKKVVVQVVHFCSEIGLLDDALMKENIITSVGIQRRYYEIAVKRMKRQLYSDKYWLLDKEKTEESVLKSALNPINSEVNPINSEEIRNTSEVSPIEIKENKSIYIFPNSDVEKAFRNYLVSRCKNGEQLNEQQTELLKKEVLSLSSDPTEQIEIIEKATIRNWKNFYPVKKEKHIKQKPIKDNNNFDRRQYNMSDLEAKLLGGGKKC